MNIITPEKFNELTHEVRNGMASIEGHFKGIEKELRRIKKAIKEFNEENGFQGTNKKT